MPRFFFNHRTSQGLSEVDIDGLKLDSLNSALDEAAYAAQGAASLADEPVAGAFEIEDEGRVLLARVPYEVLADDLKVPAEDLDPVLPSALESEQTTPEE